MTLRHLDLEALKAVPLIARAVRIFRRSRLCPPRGAGEDQRRLPKDHGRRKLSGRPAFLWSRRSAEFLDELESDEFREAFEEKFALDLAGRPTTITVRGQCSPRDGRIHTDTKSKIITILIYMNAGWEHPGGRLRLLKSADNLDDAIMEVPPTEGTLLAFKRADNSWHGHKPFAGERRVIQFNWVTSEGDRRLAMLRHHVSAPFKRLIAAMRPSAA